MTDTAVRDQRAGRDDAAHRRDANRAVGLSAAGRRAAFMYGAGDVRVEEAAGPKLEQPADALARIVRSCVGRASVIVWRRSLTVGICSRHSSR